MMRTSKTSQLLQELSRDLGGLDMANYIETFESELYTTVQDLLDDDEWHGFNSQQFKFPVPTKILAKIKRKLKDFGFESASSPTGVKSPSESIDRSTPVASPEQEPTVKGEGEPVVSKAKYVKFASGQMTSSSRTDSGNNINVLSPHQFAPAELLHADASPAVRQLMQVGQRPSPRLGAKKEDSENSRTRRHQHQYVARKLRWERDLEASATEAGTTRQEREKRGLATLSEGQVLRGYFHNRGRGRSIKQDLFIFYSSNLVAPAKGDKDPGAIYWCEASARSKSKDCCLPFTQIADVYLGKQTKVFLLPFAADAKEDRCFSIILKDRTHVNFEAFNAEQRALWVYGIEAILLVMTQAGDPLSPGPSPQLQLLQQQSPQQQQQKQSQQQQPKQQSLQQPPQQLLQQLQLSPQEQQQSKAKRGKRGEKKEMSSKQLLVTELATQLIKTGDTFTGYYLQGALVISAAFYIFYDDVHPATAKSSSGSGAPTDELGCLYWCEPGSRVASRKCCLPLSDLTDVYFGKQSRVLTSPAAAPAPRDLCLTLVSEHGTRLSLCASSNSMFTSWMAGISTLRGAYNYRAMREYRARAGSEETFVPYTLSDLATPIRSGNNSPSLELADGTSTPKGAPGTKLGPSSRTFSAELAGGKAVDRGALAVRMLKAPSPSSNVIDENVVIRMMAKGALFTGYFANKGKASRHKLLVFYSAEAAGGLGALHWCDPAQRVKSAACCMPINTIKNVYVGKQTKVFRLTVAAGAVAEHCFSIVSSDRTHVNFEASSAGELSWWLYGVRTLLKRAADTAGDHSPSRSKSNSFGSRSQSQSASHFYSTSLAEDGPRSLSLPSSPSRSSSSPSRSHRSRSRSRSVSPSSQDHVRSRSQSPSFSLRSLRSVSPSSRVSDRSPSLSPSSVSRSVSYSVTTSISHSHKQRSVSPPSKRTGRRRHRSSISPLASRSPSLDSGRSRSPSHDRGSKWRGSKHDTTRRSSSSLGNLKDKGGVAEASKHGGDERMVALKEEHVDAIMQMMHDGCCFTGYFEYQGEAIKQEFLVLYRPHPWPGALYWCEPDNVVESGDCCLSLTMVEDMYLGKHTKVFLSETASDAPADRCFSIFSKDKTHVNFEARSAEERSSWVQGITHILANSGMNIIESMQEVHAKSGPKNSSDPFSSSDSDDDKRQNGSSGDDKRQNGSSSGSSRSSQRNGFSSSIPSAVSSSFSVPASGKPSKPASRHVGRSKKGSSRNPVGPRLRERRSNMQPIDEENRQKNHRKISFVLNKDKGGMSRYKIAEEDPTVLFQLLAKMGQGSYGSVFTARDKRDDNLVAIKVLQVEEGAPLHKLKAEIHTLRKCHSKYIVAYKGTFHKNNEIWIVMEHCNVGSLCDLMAITDRTLNEEQIAAVLHMSLLGLEYLHVQRKIHRDIKCGNILVSKDGVCKLADFGVSAQLTHTCSKRRTVIGTPYWMAPEVLDTSAEYNGKADIWSLAITAIEMAQGDPPHSDLHPMRAIFVIPGNPPPLLSEPEKWSEEFKDFLAVCLQKSPDDRPSARRLLSHPFIIKAKKADGPAVIKQLVEQSMREIDAYRAMETSMQSIEVQAYSAEQGYSEVKREEGEEYKMLGSLDSPGMATSPEVVLTALMESVKSPESSQVRSDDGFEHDSEESGERGSVGSVGSPNELQTAYSASYRAKKIKERRAALRRLEASSLSLTKHSGPVVESLFAKSSGSNSASSLPGSALLQSSGPSLSSGPSPSSLQQPSSSMSHAPPSSTPSASPSPSKTSSTPSPSKTSSHRGGHAQLAAAARSRKDRAANASPPSTSSSPSKPE